MIKPQIIIAVIIHSLIAISFIGDSDYAFLPYFVGAIVLFNLIGIIMIASRKIILGAWVFMISSALLVPIGLIGVLGARKIIDEEKKKKFYNEE